MSDETTVEAPIAEPETPVNRTEQLIAKHVKAHEIAKSAEPEATEEPTGEKPRGPNGQFLPEKKAAKAKEKANGKPEKAQAAAKAEAVQKPSDADNGAKGKAERKGVDPDAASAEDSGKSKFGDGRLDRAKQLFFEGRIAEGMRLIGMPENVPNGMWKSLRKEAEKQERLVLAAKQEVDRQRDAYKVEAQKLSEQLRPFAQAADAIAAGDEDKVFELIFGKTVDAWQRERLGKMARGDLRKDPVVTDLTKRLEAERLEREKLMRTLEERDRQAAEREHQAKMAENAAKYRDDLANRLSETGDERLMAASLCPWFVEMVRKERLAGYTFDEETGAEDMPTEEEAIERVYNKKRLTAEQWEELTGGLDSPEKSGPGTLRVNGDRRATDVKRVAKAPTTLSRSEAADAVTHEKPAPGSRELQEYYARLATRGMHS